jgi:hypothetical protein
LIKRPPVFTNRCCKLVSDQWSTLFGSTNRPHKVGITLSPSRALERLNFRFPDRSFPADLSGPYFLHPLHSHLSLASASAFVCHYMLLGASAPRCGSPPACPVKRTKVMVSDKGSEVPLALYRPRICTNSLLAKREDDACLQAEVVIPPAEAIGSLRRDVVRLEETIGQMLSQRDVHPAAKAHG